MGKSQSKQAKKEEPEAAPAKGSTEEQASGDAAAVSAGKEKVEDSKAEGGASADAEKPTSEEAPKEKTEGEAEKSKDEPAAPESNEDATKELDGEKPEERQATAEAESEQKTEEEKKVEDEAEKAKDEPAAPEVKDDAAKEPEEEKAEERQATTEAESEPQPTEGTAADGGELSRPPLAPDPTTDDESQKRKVTLKWDKGGEEVKVSGNWDDWTSTAMVKEDDVFTLEIEILPGKYQYKFIVNGEWKHDESQPFGEEDGQTNNILTVE